MLEFASVVLKFIQSKAFPYVLLVVSIAVIAFIWQGNMNEKRKARMANQNMLAQTDTVKAERRSNGVLQNSISGFIASEKELKRINKSLAESVKKEKGKVLTLNSVVLTLIQDKEDLKKYLAELESETDSMIVINDSIFQIPWKLTYRYDDRNYDIFEGKSQIIIGVGDPIKVQQQWTRMTSRESSIHLTFGQKIENKQLRVFVNSTYPGLSAQSLEGVLIDPNKNPYIKSLIKKRHWFTGFGIGPNITLGYDFINGKTNAIIGIGMQYNVYQW